MSPESLGKTVEIMAHISKLFDFYGENEAFFDEYVEGVLSLNLDKSLICFRDLVKQMDWMTPKCKKLSIKKAKD